VDEQNSERSLALAGIVATVLIVVGAFLPGSPPKVDDSSAKIAKFLVDNSDQIRWGGFIAALGSVVLLGWLGAVWRLLRRAEGGAPMLAVGAAAGAVMAAALFNVGGVLLGVMGIVGPATMGASTTRTLYVVYNNVGAAGAMGLALFVGAFAIVILQTAVLPRVMGWLGALLALALLGSGGAIASTRDFFFVLGVIGFLGFALWTLIVSVMMYRGAGARATASTSTTPASAA
jgi:hypothetical protein